MSVAVVIVLSLLLLLVVCCYLVCCYYLLLLSLSLLLCLYFSRLGAHPAARSALPCPLPGSEDSTVKLWTLPEGGLTDGNMGAEDATADLTFNYTAVR